MSSRSVSISTDTIVRVILILLVLGFLYLIKDVLALFFVAIILSSAFDPLIDWLQLRKIPRALSIVGVYVVFLAIIGGAIFCSLIQLGIRSKICLGLSLSIM